MVSTRQWTDNCAGWVPPISQIYVSVLFYIQVIRAMDAAGSLSPGSALSVLLKDFVVMFPLDSLWIPGPLVAAFKSISAFYPLTTGQFGNVTPSLPRTPGWSRNRGYAPADTFAPFLPNIKEIISLSSPGAKFNYGGNLRLWENAAQFVPHLDLPAVLDSNKTDVQDSWARYLFLEEDSGWFRRVSDIMARYCQFFRGSTPLGDCSPAGSAAGGVVCTQVQGNIYQAPDWNEKAGNHSSFNSTDPHRIGFYSTTSNATLTFHTSCSIPELPVAYTAAAQTFQINMVPSMMLPAQVHEGQFWQIFPDAEQTRNVSVYQAIPTINRVYHSDTRVEADHR
uniref:IAA-leucine resistant 2-like n=1 Tax=Erigeron canadensis TaxID=72917 RepID=UPI001CB9C2EB|nr:IAA-leucine resistant 2-like [Erigeron canadensis]